MIKCLVTLPLGLRPLPPIYLNGCRFFVNLSSAVTLMLLFLILFSPFRVKGFSLLLTTAPSQEQNILKSLKSLELKLTR